MKSGVNIYQQAKHLWATMDVGTRIIVQSKELRQAVIRYNSERRQYGKVFKTKKVLEGYLIWRIQ